jgi:TorA maturation chaperone TorD
VNSQPSTLPNDALTPEDRGRANLYALIGRLFYAAPDSDLLARLREPGDSAAGADPGGGLEGAWQALRELFAATTPTTVRLEYDALFVGVGKAQVTPYTSHYITHNAPDRHLLELRGLLAQWGLARGAGVFEAEDHVSGLCDAMRFLIEEHMPLSDQRLFFERYLDSAMSTLATAVMASQSAVFYKQVIKFVQTFFDVERAAFDMDDTTAA